ncbi:MAG: acylneuraminate cytidylyltransferase family protein, partial [bacterium]
MKIKNIVAIITARAGSKELPHKNIKLLAGKPLIAYTIEAALGCSAIQRCIVSTEDALIKAVSLRFGAEVIDRPPELATDSAFSEDVVRHVLLSLKKNKEYPEYFVLLQPTSPLRTSKHLTDCLKKFFNSKAMCSVSLVESENHPYKTLTLKKNKLSPLINFVSIDRPRQLLPKAYRPNGAIYIMKSDLFMKRRSFFTKDFIPFFMNRMDSVDIDNELDLLIADALLRK